VARPDRSLDWTGVVAVACPGSSLRAVDLSPLVAAGCPVIAVNRAHEHVFADVLYAADLPFWQHYANARGFPGERIVAVLDSYTARRREDVEGGARSLGLSVVNVRDETGFSLDPECLHTGSNSGFQAIDLALSRGATTVACFGLDLGGDSIHAPHPRPLRRTTDYNYGIWRRRLETAVRMLPPGRRVVNCSPASPLDVLPRARAVDLV